MVDYADSAIAVLEVDGINVSQKNVKEAIAEAARVFKQYVDAKVLYETCVTESDPEYSCYHEHAHLNAAEGKLNALIVRV